MSFTEAVKKAVVGGGAVVEDTPVGVTNSQDHAKVLVHGLIVGASAAIATLVEYGTGAHWGQYNAVVIPLVSMFGKYLLQLLKSNDPINPEVPTETK